MSSQHPVDKKKLNGKAIMVFFESLLVSKTNMNLNFYNEKKKD